MRHLSIPLTSENRLSILTTLLQKRDFVIKTHKACLPISSQKKCNKSISYIKRICTPECVYQISVHIYNHNHDHCHQQKNDDHNIKGKKLWKTSCDREASVIENQPK